MLRLGRRSPPQVRCRQQRRASHAKPDRCIRQIAHGIPAKTVVSRDVWGRADHCVDASSYEGVEFTLSGDLSTCQMTFFIGTYEDSPGLAGCTSEDCRNPQAAVPGLGERTVLFTDALAGAPQAGVDPMALTNLTWQLSAPPAGDSPCMADLQARRPEVRQRDGAIAAAETLMRSADAKRRPRSTRARRVGVMRRTSCHCGRLRARPIRSEVYPTLETVAVRRAGAAPTIALQ
jgi:hypothetical protein